MDAEELLEKYGSKVDRLYDTVASSDVFERQFGAELASWEMHLQQQFKERVSSSRSRIRGFVKLTKDKSLILVTPSPWLLEGEFVYLGEGVSYPDDGAFVEISGPNVVVPRLLEGKKQIVRAVHAEDIETTPLDITSIVTRPPSLKSLSRMLFENVGMAEASKRVFSQLYASSPPTMESIGGLTAGIQAIASKSKVKKLFRFMKTILPPSMRTQRSSKAFRGVQVNIPKLWRMDTGSVSTSKLKSLCLDRRDPSGYREVSLAAMTEESTSTLPDVPIALDSGDFFVETRNAADLRLPITKAAITFQLLTPKVSQRSIDSTQTHIQERLEILRSNFGLADSSITRGGILDSDFLGRPLSTIKLARASARAYWKDKITAKEIKRTWDRVLEPALKEFIEITEIKEESQKRWGEETSFDKINTKILKALQKLDTGKKGSPGPTLDEITEESGVSRHEVAQTLNKMKNDGLIYEPRQGHYRLA
jgi:uncharacterized ubiquitin-like protein YukD